MTPSDIRPRQLWRSRDGRRTVEVLANDGREVGAWIELRDTSSGAIYPKRWHNLAREFRRVPTG